MSDTDSDLEQYEEHAFVVNDAVPTSGIASSRTESADISELLATSR